MSRQVRPVRPEAAVVAECRPGVSVDLAHDGVVALVVDPQRDIDRVLAVVGGGFVVVPALVLVLGFSMPVAVGTSLLVIAINSASALVSRAGQGVPLDWTLIGVFTLAAIVGSLAGGHLSARVRPERLTAAFALLLVAVGLYTAAQSVPQLV